jgi:hypothetical protein
MVKKFTYENLNNCMAEVISNINTHDMIGNIFHPDIKFYDINYYSINRLSDNINLEKLKAASKTISLDVHYLSECNYF